MKAFRLLLFAGIAILLLKVGKLPAQHCGYWSEPVSLSDSLSDNMNATMYSIPYGGPDYYVFWERWMEDLGSEIVYIDLYNQDASQRIVFGEGYKISNPQVVPVQDYPPPVDTLAYIFYQTNQSGNEDLYYVIMKDTGFTAPAPFAVSPLDESHLRVSPGGGIVWQESDKILYSRLKQNNSGFYFEPSVLIDEGDCRNPDIQNSDPSSVEQYIAWEKGSTDNPEIWYSYWSYDNDEWSEPVLLFDGGNHSNLRFSTGIEGFSSAFPILVSDKINDAGQFQISGYDFYFEDEFTSGFEQSKAFLPDIFTIDLITKDYWENAFLSFKNDEEGNNSDIFSSDYGYLQPEFVNYCRIDSTSQPDVNPQLFMGAWHFSYFDLFCIWESWRNGHWQLFSSTTPVVIGSVPESIRNSDLNIRSYPNPVLNQVTFNIHLQASAKVKLMVYNSMGQIVATILDGSLEKGDHMVKWNTNNLLPGIYSYRLSTVNCQLSTSGKMVVVR